MKPTTDFPSYTGRRRIKLNVAILMAQRGIRSVSALHRLLIQQGVDISHAQLNRIVDNRPGGKLNLDVMNGLMNLFQCSVHDLFGEEPAPDEEDESSQT